MYRIEIDGSGFVMIDTATNTEVLQAKASDLTFRSFQNGKFYLYEGDSKQRLKDLTTGKDSFHFSDLENNLGAGFILTQ